MNVYQEYREKYKKRIIETLNNIQLDGYGYIVELYHIPKEWKKEINHFTDMNTYMIGESSKPFNIPELHDLFSLCGFGLKVYNVND